MSSPTKTRPCRGAGAFTLVEVMVAISVLAMAMSAIYYTWTAILRATRSGAEVAAHVQRERVALRTIEEALTCSVIYHHVNGQQAQAAATNLYSFLWQSVDANHHEVSFVARLPHDFLGNALFPNQPLRRVTFAIEKNAEGREDLILRQQPLNALSEAAMGVDLLAARTVLAQNVEIFQFFFWSTIVNDWVDYWDTPEDLPERVRVMLALRDRQGREAMAEALSVREFSIRAEVITKDMLAPDVPAATVAGGGKGGRFNPGNMPPQLIARFDSDGDGKLDPAEMARLQAAMENFKGRGGGGGGVVDIGPPGKGGFDKGGMDRGPGGGGGFGGGGFGGGGFGGGGAGGGGKRR